MTKSNMTRKGFISLIDPYNSSLSEAVRVGTDTYIQVMEQRGKGAAYCFVPHSLLNLFLIETSITISGMDPSAMGWALPLKSLIKKKMPC